MLLTVAGFSLCHPGKSPFAEPIEPRESPRRLFRFARRGTVPCRLAGRMGGPAPGFRDRARIVAGVDVNAPAAIAEHAHTPLSRGAHPDAFSRRLEQLLDATHASRRIPRALPGQRPSRGLAEHTTRAAAKPPLADEPDEFHRRLSNELDRLRPSRAGKRNTRSSEDERPDSTPSAVAFDLNDLPDDLVSVIRAWPTLDRPGRAAVLAALDLHGGESARQPPTNGRGAARRPLTMR